ncbi:hypothetical protein BT67DRAFT_437477 [Trichocladium antarcticum]|uniref:Uncharacterized protein n=1 Tax=Trichocladium antarcticum TaxID=1450529 RepID=A0AAN6ZGD5_9PEZI|nr:hypothetical protein BT67DRAFT_437477 [Trichocladium antarcticum]
MAIISASPVKKAQNKHSTPRKRNRIFARYESGVPASEVAKKEGVSKAHVRGVVKRFPYQDYGVSKLGRRRLTKLDDRDKRRILRKGISYTIDLLYYRCNPTISL